MVMMDGTDLLSTAKEAMNKKIKIMYNRKTNVMAVNGTSDDKDPIIYNNNTIRYCKQYIYLGSPFSNDAKPSTSIKFMQIKKCVMP